MKITIRLSLTIILAFICALTSVAQEQPPAIEVITENEKAQFAAQGLAQTVHVEIFSPSGELVFESDSPGGQAVEWQMRNDRGKRVADGVYLAIMTVTDFSGKRRKRIEQIIVSTESETATGPSDSLMGPINGTGSTGKLAKFTGVNAIGDSVITESVNRVGVGTTVAPTASLQVNAAQPAALATSGTPAATLLQTSGGKGGNTTGAAAGVQIGGAGASIALLAGNGGDAPAGDTRGKGGNITLQPGSTGAGTGTAGLSGNVLISPTGIGNVGIGTAATTSRLTVNGGIQILGAGSGIKFPDGVVQTKAIIGTGTTGAIAKFTGLNSFGDSLIRENAGNVGIGTGAPSSKLQVVDPSNTGLRVQTNTAGGTVASFGGFGDFQIDAPGVVGGRFIVKEGGNIGVGTLTPLARLDIQGGADANGTTNPQAMAFQWRGAGFRHWIRTRHNSILGSGNAIDFFVNNSTVANGSTGAGLGSTHVMTLDSGRVGIGTINPSEALTVVGKIQSTSGGFKFPDGTVQVSAGVSNPTYHTTFKDTLESVQLAGWDGAPMTSVLHLNLPVGTYLLTATVSYYNDANFLNSNNNRSFSCKFSAEPGNDRFYHSSIPGLATLTTTVHSMVSISSGSVDYLCSVGFNPPTHVFARARRLTAVKIDGNVVVQ